MNGHVWLLSALLAAVAVVGEAPEPAAETREAASSACSADFSDFFSEERKNRIWDSWGESPWADPWAHTMAYLWADPKDSLLAPLLESPSAYCSVSSMVFFPASSA